MENIQYEHQGKDFFDNSCTYITSIDSRLMMMMMVSFLFYSSHKILITQLGTKWGAIVKVHTRQSFHTNCLYSKYKHNTVKTISSHSNHTLFSLNSTYCQSYSMVPSHKLLILVQSTSLSSYQEDLCAINMKFDEYSQKTKAEADLNRTKL